jgi:Flp pilus assembly protein TadD
LRKQGKFEEAAVELEEAVRLLPDDHSVRYILAQTLQRAGHSPEAAAQLQAAEKENQRQRDRNLANSDVILGVQLLQKGELAAGEAKLEEAVRLNPLDPFAQHDYGLALLLQDKLEDAIARFRTALVLRPDNPDTLYYLGRAFLKHHQPAEAVNSLRRALRVNPGDTHARNVLAVALATTADFNGAKSELQQARDLEPDNPLYERNLSCLSREMRDCTLVP